MPNPFQKKKPEDEETLEKPEAEVPAEAPEEEVPAEEETEAKPAEAAPVKGAPKASAPKGEGKGSSAPMTPGQGVPDAKAEPEGDKEKLPKEADTSEAKPRPKGLPSVAMMTKAEAEGADKDPMNNPHIQRLATLVHGLAKIVQEHHAKLGAMPLPGQSAPSPHTVGTQKMGMPGIGPKPGVMGAATKPGMPGAKPGMQSGLRPGLPGVAGQGMRPGVTPPTPGAALTLEQIQAMMGIIEAANSGRVPRQAASMLIATGFGLDPKAALGMVSPDAPSALSGDPKAPIPGALESGVNPEDPEGELSALNPEEEEMEEGEGEEFEEELEEGEEPALAPGEEEEEDHTGFTYGKYHRRDASVAVGDDTMLAYAIARLEARRTELAQRLDALAYARNLYYDDLLGE
jgi:hypothetical protein